jgi:YggT family protein
MQIFLLYLYWALNIYFYIMILYVLLTWTPLINSQFGRILKRIVDPYLGIFRGWFVIGNMDFTPMVGLLLYQFVLMIIAPYAV